MPPATAGEQRTAARVSNSQTLRPVPASTAKIRPASDPAKTRPSRMAAATHTRPPASYFHAADKEGLSVSPSTPDRSGDPPYIGQSLPGRGASRGAARSLRTSSGGAFGDASF